MDKIKIIREALNAAEYFIEVCRNFDTAIEDYADYQSVQLKLASSEQALAELEQQQKELLEQTFKEGKRLGWIECEDKIRKEQPTANEDLIKKIKTLTQSKEEVLLSGWFVDAFKALEECEAVLSQVRPIEQPTTKQKIMNQMLFDEYRKRRVAEYSVDDIVKDFTDRRGLRQEWEQIDDDIQKEITDAWKEAIVNRIGQTFEDIEQPTVNEGLLKEIEELKLHYREEQKMRKELEVELSQVKPSAAMINLKKTTELKDILVGLHHLSNNIEFYEGYFGKLSINGEAGIIKELYEQWANIKQKAMQVETLLRLFNYNNLIGETFETQPNEGK